MIKFFVFLRKFVKRPLPFFSCLSSRYKVVREMGVVDHFYIGTYPHIITIIVSLDLNFMIFPTHTTDY